MLVIVHKGTLSILATPRASLYRPNQDSNLLMIRKNNYVINYGYIGIQTSDAVEEIGCIRLDNPIEHIVIQEDCYVLYTASNDKPASGGPKYWLNTVTTPRRLTDNDSRAWGLNSAAIPVTNRIGTYLASRDVSHDDLVKYVIRQLQGMYGSAKSIVIRQISLTDLYTNIELGEGSNELKPWAESVVRRPVKVLNRNYEDIPCLDT